MTTFTRTLATISCISRKKPSIAVPLPFAIPMPSTKESTRAVMTSQTGATLIVMNGSNAAPAAALPAMLSIVPGRIAAPRKYAEKPAMTVDRYARPSVMPNSLFARLPRSAMPTATNEMIKSGIINERNMLNSDVNVENARTIITNPRESPIPATEPSEPRNIPAIIPMSKRGSNPNLDKLILLTPSVFLIKTFVSKINTSFILFIKRRKVKTPLQKKYRVHEFVHALC